MGGVYRHRPARVVPGAQFAAVLAAGLPVRSAISTVVLAPLAAPAAARVGLRAAVAVALAPMANAASATGSNARALSAALQLEGVGAAILLETGRWTVWSPLAVPMPAGAQWDDETASWDGGGALWDQQSSFGAYGPIGGADWVPLPVAGALWSIRLQ